ncbi:unnamed protein product [Penicillium nalgiovense]|nr:unnamed protein product [Penicillium nalgiovense]
MQWVDYTVIVRVCMFPIDEFARIARHQRRVGITLGVLWMLQDDTVIRDESATGQFYMQPDLSSLYRNGGMTAPAAPSATVMTFWRSETNGPLDGCPRTTLQTMANKLQSEYNLNILFPLLQEFHQTLVSMDIFIQQFHAESAPGQFEFVLPPATPLAAVDALFAARQVVTAVAERRNLRATLHPRPLPGFADSAAHVHLSISPSRHLPAKRTSSRELWLIIR